MSHDYLFTMQLLGLIINWCALLTSKKCMIRQVFHVLKLEEGQDITALALNIDNTNLLVSTADKQLIIFTDPAVS